MKEETDWQERKKRQKEKEKKDQKSEGKEVLLNLFVCIEKISSEKWVES